MFVGFIKVRLKRCHVTTQEFKLKQSQWNCLCRETTPIFNMSMALAEGTDKRLLDIAINVIRAIEVPVTLSDITTLSEYRKDAHISVYTIRQGKLLTSEHKADPVTFADCLHWCLPGAASTWNELIYAYIIRSWCKEFVECSLKYSIQLKK